MVALSRNHRPGRCDQGTTAPAALPPYVLFLDSEPKDALQKGFKVPDGCYTFLTGTPTGLALIRDPFACKPAMKMGGHHGVLAKCPAHPVHPAHGSTQPISDSALRSFHVERKFCSRGDWGWENTCSGTPDSSMMPSARKMT